MNNADMPAMPIKEDVWADPRDPGKGIISCTGLTKREAFAMVAMQGILSNPYWNEFGDFSADGIAESATRNADALLAELAKETT